MRVWREGIVWPPRYDSESSKSSPFWCFYQRYCWTLLIT